MATAGQTLTLRHDTINRECYVPRGRYGRPACREQQGVRPRVGRSYGALGSTDMGLNIALVGASGAVGAQFLKILGNWGVQVSRLRLLASSRSAGTKLTFRGETLEVEETTPRSFEGIDLAFVSATTEASLKYCPMAKAAGAVAIER